ncbi:hypothetical protein [Verrucosispora sp. WMMD1129]|uniref:hypothetical protein n=1 Tax=Verrucosispora sp. WMMD1129 TaxID=3016093 RepID=UPI00249CA037|nr:hypothetical protein [Verrucosispora sp. WMMD1129]WFE44268.1 hypothetical protein O7624_07930 [Verrucosispora sp. WMMD1129]
MPAAMFEALHGYEATRDGRRIGPWRAGQPVTPFPGDLPWLVRDAPGLFDLARPLTPERAAELAQRLEDADAERARRQHAVDTAVRGHVFRWGNWCPGAVARDPHVMLGGHLTAVEAGGGWRVACPGCVDRPARPVEG